MRHNWPASLSNYVDSKLVCVRMKLFGLKVLTFQFFPVALSVILLLVYAKCYAPKSERKTRTEANSKFILK